MNSPTSASQRRETQVIQAFLELSDTLVADFDIIDSLTMLATRCVELLDTAATGILLVDTEQRLRVLATSSEQARLIELFQLQNNEGPCLEAFATGQPTIDTNLATATERWPQFAPYALGAGYESVYAIPMRLRGNIIGALNLFRASPGKLDAGDLALAQALADLASITILQAAAATEARGREQHLQHALDSRIVIEQAKGILAEHAHIDMPAAFELLRNRARNTNTKLTDLATHIVAGELDLHTLTTDGTNRH